MPSAAVPFCPTQGCTNRSQGKCQDCRRTYEQHRGSRHARGYTNRWARYSANRLALHPFCAECGGLADVTDHIRSAQSHPELFWDEANHQSLCGPCNRRKAIREEGAFGR